MKFLKFIFWLVVIGGIVYGSYYVYTRWFGQNNEVIIKGKENIFQDFQKKVSKEISQYATQALMAGKAKTKSLVKDTLGEMMTTLGEKIYSTGLNLKTDTFQNFQENFLATSSNSSFSFPPPQAAIITKVNIPFSLVINGGQAYEIDWGDRSQDKGKIKKGEVVILNHYWTKSGDYFVEVRIENGATSTIYSFPVRVY